MFSSVRPLVAVAMVAVLASGATAAPASARGPAPARGAALALPKLERFRLDNGLEVAVMPLPTAPAVSVQLWYHAGSKDEPREHRGTAHMFEHMMFKGSQHVPPDEHARSLSRLGGYATAATTEDATYYVDVIPADYLDHAIALEADRMRGLVFRDEVVAQTRSLLKSEIGQQEANPLSAGLLHFLAVTYRKHPYAWTAGGNVDELDRTTTAELKRFYDTYYVPSNALLVVAGNVTRDQVEASAKKHFAAVPAGAKVPRLGADTIEPPQTEVRRHTLATAQLGMVLIGYHIPEARHADVYALQLMSLILGGGDSSRLLRRIKEPDAASKQALGIAAGSPVLVREHPGVFLTFGAFVDPGRREAVEQALLDEVRKLGAQPVTADELRTAKNQIAATFVYGLQGVAGLAEQIGTSWILTGDPGQFLRDLEQIDKVSAADIQRVARAYLDPAKATIVIVPASGGASK